MEEKKEVTHSLHLEQRGHGLVTGVTEMKSFDEENIFIQFPIFYRIQIMI